MTHGNKNSVGMVYSQLKREIGTDKNFKRKIVWTNVFGLVLLHLAAIYGLWLCLWAKFLTIIYGKGEH